MKKKLLSMSVPVITGIMFLFSFNGIVLAQNPIPNGDFESWTSMSLETPQFYPNTSSRELFYRNHSVTNVAKVSPAHHGSYALQLTTIATGGDTAFGYIVNGNPDGDPNSWVGGIAYSEKPTGIRGYYKCNVMAGDSALVLVAFSKAGSNVGSYVITIGGVQSGYTLFDFTFSPALSVTPDSVMIAFTSSNVMADVQIAGSMITFDSVSFTGVGSQPSLMNGSFELWQNQLVSRPNSWYYDGDGSGNGMSQTSDAHAGNYALQLTTFYTSNENGPQARAGRIGTGWYPNNCSGNCQEQGGHPYSLQVDTLAFYYKYAPSANDTAIVQLNFKKNGNQIWGSSIYLFPAPSYQYVEFPISIGTAPDTVIINLQSSSWNDTALIFVGSVFKVDDIHFKSQLLTGLNEVSNAHATELYPNPVNTSATLAVDPQASLRGAELRIYDVFGRTVKSMTVTEHKTTFEKGDLSGGVYHYEVRNNAEILKTGKMIVE